jgi:hypothetical protein
MKKILYDTSFFLNFYQTNVKEKKAKPLEILDELNQYKEYLIFPTQIYNEYKRNREIRLRELKNLLEDSINKVLKYFPHTTSIIQHLPGFNEITNAKKDIIEKAKNMVQDIENMIENENEDPVFNKFINIYKDKKVLKYEVTDEIIKKAYNRKLLGNPPISDGKNTIGDEIIWETIIENVKDDLIIVAYDKTYNKYFSFLKEDYKNRTEHDFILATEYSYKAIQKLNKKISKQLIEIENKHIESVTSTQIFSNVYPSGVLNPLTGQASGNIFSKGFTTIPGGTAYYFGRTCPNCQNNCSWIGSFCPRCGSKLDDINCV